MGACVDLKDLAEMSIEVMPAAKFKFLNSIAPLEMKHIASMNETAFTLNHQQASAIEREIVEGKLRVRFVGGCPRACSELLSNWEGRKRRTAGEGMNDAVLDMLLAIAEKSKNGKNRE